MEQRTATQNAADTAKEPSRDTPRKRERRDAGGKEAENSGLLMRGGKRMFRTVAKPASRVWETYLREPVAKGLITTGAVLTETGRLILTYGRGRREKADSEASAGKTAAAKRTLH